MRRLREDDLMEAVKKKGVGTNLTEGVIWKVLLTFAVPIIPIS